MKNNELEERDWSDSRMVLQIAWSPKATLGGVREQQWKVSQGTMCLAEGQPG